MAGARFSVLLACGAMLALGACSNSRTVTTGGDPAELAAEKERADAAEAARDAAEAARDAAEATRDAAEVTLSELRGSLRNAQAALKAVGSGANARVEANRALTAVEADLEEVQSRLMAQPASPAKTAVGDAVTAVGDAVAAVKDALAPISSSGGTLSFASMHTTLDRAQAALDDAQTRITAALAADGLTDALRTALSQAQVTLSTAQNALVPVLRDELAEAEADAAAQRARAVKEETRADNEKARADRAEKDAAEERARAARNAAELRGETTLGAPITPERAVRNILPALSTGGTDNVTWTARTNAVGAANPNGLEIKDEAVAYATGKTLISADGNGNDEFKLRGLTARGELRPGFDATGGLEFHGGIEGGSTGGTDNADLGVTLGDGDWDRTDARVLSSIQLERDGSGFTMKMGGAGTIFHDMERHAAFGPGAFSNLVGNGNCANTDDAKCDDPATMDITAAFDNPAKDPDGDASYHFRVVVPTNPATPHTEERPLPADSWQRFTNADGKRAYRVNPSYTGVVDLGADGDMGGDDADADTMGYANLDSEEYTDPDGAKYKVAWLPSTFTVPSGATLLEYRRAGRIDAGVPVDELGVYTVKLSNYAGMDDNNEHRYLQYAAYGLFNFLDYSAGTRFARLQAFHFGYDAFNDADDNRPMDFSADVTTATFNGKTTGWVLQNPEGHALGHISRLLRVRGDVSLTATLGGGTSNGSINGSMVNFEYLRNGVWSKFPNLVLSHADQKTMDGVTLMPADIGADGAYAGVAKVMADRNKRFGEGRYGGAFYGPRTLGELETAGYWMLPRHIGEDSSPESCPSTVRTGGSCTTFGTIIGSFGAVSEPPASP